MRLYRMNTATIGADIPVPCSLIRTDAGQHIPIDTGYAPEIVAASQHPEHRGIRVGQYRPIVEHLADLGLGVTDIDILIATHLDTDHAGMIDAFSRASTRRRSPPRRRASPPIAAIGTRPDSAIVRSMVTPCSCRASR